MDYLIKTMILNQFTARNSLSLSSVSLLPASAKRAHKTVLTAAAKQCALFACPSNEALKIQKYTPQSHRTFQSQNVKIIITGKMKAQLELSEVTQRLRRRAANKRLNVRLRWCLR